MFKENLSIPTLSVVVLLIVMLPYLALKLLNSNVIKLKWEVGS